MKSGRPKKLTQAESKKFLMPENETVDEIGNSPTVYMGKRFYVAEHWQGTNLLVLLIDGVRAEVTPGAKEGTFAIRETIGMFNARMKHKEFSRKG